MLAIPLNKRNRERSMGVLMDLVLQMPGGWLECSVSFTPEAAGTGDYSYPESSVKLASYIHPIIRSL